MHLKTLQRLAGSQYIEEVSGHSEEEEMTSVDAFSQSQPGKSSFVKNMNTMKKKNKRRRLKNPEEVIDEIYLSKLEISRSEISGQESDQKKWTERQREYMKEYIKHQVKFFTYLQDELIMMLVEYFERVTYPAGSRFVRKGEEGDCMYILYSGKVGIFLDGEEQESTDIVLEAPKAVAEQALESKAVRGADCGAITDVKMLRITTKIYDKYIADPRKRQKYVNLRILKNIYFFKDWSLLRLQTFNDCLGEKNYQIGDTIYQQGADPEVFFVLVKGKVSVETEIEIDEYNRYPTQNKQWESVRTTTKYLYKLDDIKDNSIFGHEEIVLCKKREKTIKALEETQVFYMNLNMFQKQMDLAA